jgi:ABC-2 type transport system permease protein
MKAMNKALIIAKREYRAAVRTKGFLVSLLLLPVFMGGGLLVFSLLKDKVDISDKRIVVIDYSGQFGEYLVRTAEAWNKDDIFNDKREQVYPCYYIDLPKPDTSATASQKLSLSERVRKKEIHAFLQIGAGVIHPKEGEEQSRIMYYGENAAVDNVRSWFNNVINNKIREIRIAELGIDQSKVKNLFYWVNTEGMGLVNIDTKTGQVADARKSSEMQTILVPYILLLLMFMMVMMSAMPLLTTVMEEKTERIAEVLLGSVTPWQDHRKPWSFTDDFSHLYCRSSIYTEGNGFVRYNPL